MPLVLSLFTVLTLLVSQPGIKVSDGRITPAAAGADTAAFVTLANGGMYEVYLVAASSEIAERVEIVQVADGSPRAVTEVAIPAFDRLEMSPDGTHLKLVGLKKAIATGDSIPILLQTDDGASVTAVAVAGPGGR